MHYSSLARNPRLGTAVIAMPRSIRDLKNLFSVELGPPFRLLEDAFRTRLQLYSALHTQIGMYIPSENGLE
jgi:hypothetical protein